VHALRTAAVVVAALRPEERTEVVGDSGDVWPVKFTRRVLTRAADVEII
jgi:hypothetical protein